jgi:hypothetical protein
MNHDSGISADMHGLLQALITIQASEVVMYLYRCRQLQIDVPCLPQASWHHEVAAGLLMRAGRR